MTSYTISPVWGAGAQLFDNNGDPLSGGKIFTYLAGTTTPATTYIDPIGSFANTNPIIADAAGRLSNEIWLPVSGAFKFVLKDANDTLIATYDNVPSLPQPPVSNDAGSIIFNPGYTVTAGAFTVGSTYEIASVGSTNFMTIGAAANVVGVVFTATGPGSGNGTAYYVRTVESKLRDSYSIEDFNAVGDGVANDRPVFETAVATGNPLLITQGTYLMVPSNDDPFSPINYASLFTTSAKMRGNNATIKTDAFGKKVLFFSNLTLPIDGIELSDLDLRQPNWPAMSGGVNDNHFLLALSAVTSATVTNINGDNSDLVMDIGGGAVGVPDRGSYYNYIANLNAKNIRGMGIQIFGCSNSSFSGLIFTGYNPKNAYDRASFSGVRFAAYNFAQSRKNFVEANVTGFNVGVTFQQYSGENEVHIYAENCTQGAQVLGPSSGLLETTVSRDNVINLRAVDCDYGIYDGGVNNTFNFTIKGPSEWGVFQESAGTAGLSYGNIYRGIVRDPKSASVRLMDLRGSHNVVDVTLLGSTFVVGGVSTKTDNGFIDNSPASYNSGKITVKNCSVGALLAGDNGRFDITALDCTTGVSITGANNVVTVNTNGNVAISGDNNTVTGYIGGTVTNTGTGNSFNASGTFAPGLIGSTTAGTYTAGANDTGTWVREGRFVRFYIRLNGIITGPSGALMVTGLPFRQNQNGFYFYRNETASSNGFAFPRTTSGSNADQISLSGQTYSSGVVNDVSLSGVYVAE